MQFVRTAARLARLLRLQAQPPAALDIDLSTLAPLELDGAEPPMPGTVGLTVQQLTAPPVPDDVQDWRTTSPWRTQPGVRYHL